MMIDSNVFTLNFCFTCQIEQGLLLWRLWLHVFHEATEINCKREVLALLDKAVLYLVEHSVHFLELFHVIGLLVYLRGVRACLLPGFVGIKISSSCQTRNL